MLVLVAAVAAACSGARTVSPALPDRVTAASRERAPASCPKPYGGSTGVPLAVINKSALPTSDINFFFTASDPGEPSDYDYLNASGGMTLFASGNAATDLPLQSCFPGSVGTKGKGTKLVVPVLAGGRLWISFSPKFALTGTSGGQFVQPSGWVSGAPGYDVPWDFVELSNNDPGIFVDVTRVDMLGLPLNVKVLPTSKSSPWTSVGENLSKYSTMLEKFESDKPYDKLVFMVPKFKPKVPRIINPSHSDGFPDVFNDAKYYSGGFMNAVARYYQDPPKKITYGTSYKGPYCPGTWTASSDGSDFSFKNGSTSYSYPLSLFTSEYVFADNPGSTYSAGTCQYLLDKILLQELNRGVAMKKSHPVTNTSSFYPKKGVNNQYACILHNYSLHYATYAFAFDDADDQASAFANTGPTKIEVTIGAMPSTLPTAAPSPAACSAKY